MLAQLMPGQAPLEPRGARCDGFCLILWGKWGRLLKFWAIFHKFRCWVLEEEKEEEEIVDGAVWWCN